MQRFYKLEVQLETQAMVEAFLANNLMSSMLLDTEGRVAGFNHRCERRFKDIIGRSLIKGDYLADLLPASLQSDFKEDFTRVLSGEEFSKELFLESPGGSIWMKYSYIPISVSGEGRVDYVAYFAVPLNDLEKTNLHLERTELLFHKIFENTTDALFVIDASEDLTLADCNQVAVTMLGFQDKVKLKAAWDKTFHLTPYRGEALSVFRENLDRDGHFEDEFWIETAAGSLIFVEFRVTRFAFQQQKLHLVKITDVTERRNQELKLKETRELFSLVTKATRDAIFNFDLITDKAWVNEEYIQMFGYGETETQNHNAAWFEGKLHPDDRHEMVRMKNVLLDTEDQQITLEYRILHKDGHYVSVIDRDFIVRDSRGRAVAVVGAITDVSKDKEQTRKLKEQEELFKYVTRATNDGIYSFDVTNNTTWVNNEYIEMFGYGMDASDHTSEWFNSKLHPADRERTMKEVSNTVESGTTLASFEYRFLHQKGHYIHIMDRGFVIRDESGKARQIIGAITDMTPLKEKEEKLQAYETRLKDIFNTLEEIVFSFTFAQGKKAEFEFVSKASGDIWGYTMHELNSNKYLWFEKMFEEDRKNVLTPSLRKLLRLETVEIEYRIGHRNGSTIWVFSRLVPRRQPNGDILVIGSATNITDRKNAEEQLRRQNEELTRTNMELDRFVYSASHDLRAPLTSIMGLVNLFQAETNDPSHLNYLKMMDTSIRRLDKFIANIVDYSRNTRLEDQRELIDFRQVVNESLDTHKYMEGFAAIDVQVMLHQQHEFWADRTRLQMVVNNLVSNAIKYQKPGLADNCLHVTVTVDEQRAVIAVKDNGIGIGQPSLEKIFDMFYTASADNRGSGIGLYIVKETVARMGGSIAVQSDPPNGSTFTVVLPRLS